MRPLAAFAASPRWALLQLVNNFVVTAVLAGAFQYSSRFTDAKTTLKYQCKIYSTDTTLAAETCLAIEPEDQQYLMALVKFKVPPDKVVHCHFHANTDMQAAILATHRLHSSPAARLRLTVALAAWQPSAAIKYKVHTTTRVSERMVKGCLQFLDSRKYQKTDGTPDMRLIDQRLLILEELFSELCTLHPVSLDGPLTGDSFFLVYGAVLSSESFDDLLRTSARTGTTPRCWLRTSTCTRRPVAAQRRCGSTAS